MNKRLVIYLMGSILLIEAAAMAPALLIALIYGEGDAMALLQSMLVTAAVASPLRFLSKPKEKNLRAKEGFVVVALVWVLLSFFGALPFLFSGMIPNVADAIFESVSGFTTTGASILTKFDGQPHGVMFWRSFTHWIGGMGVLVLTLALLPQMSGRTSHLVRAESPGPSLSKIAPKMGDSSKILYIIYAVLTLAEFILLMIAGMYPYDAAIHALGTAGTGGFSNYGASVAAFNSPAIEWIITIFMLIFGVNFALYYRLFLKDWRSVVRNEELKWFGSIVGFAVLFFTVSILPQCKDFMEALRLSAFQVASLVSTTGFATTDFNLWPQYARMLVVLLMFVGGCAGSTAGGIKVVRVALLFKQGKREIRRTFQPRKVQVVRFEGKGVDESMLHQVAVFAFVYMMLILGGMFLVSFDGRFGFEENFTAALTCVNNVGPGLGKIGPVENFAGYSNFSKCVLSVLMLAGRLELFPILLLFHPAVWKKG